MQSLYRGLVGERRSYIAHYFRSKSSKRDFVGIEHISSNRVADTCMKTAYWSTFFSFSKLVTYYFLDICRSKVSFTIRAFQTLFLFISSWRKATVVEQSHWRRWEDAGLCAMEFVQLRREEFLWDFMKLIVLCFNNTFRVRHNANNSKRTVNNTGPVIFLWSYFSDPEILKAKEKVDGISTQKTIRLNKWRYITIG